MSTDSTATPRPQRQRPKTSRYSGIAQLSLVEHALCPLDARVSIQPGLLHATEYQFTDKQRNRRTANVEVGAAFGLSPFDELYLHGLSSLVFAQHEPTANLYATPNWCLRQLGIIDSSRDGGKRYQDFRAAIRRLSGVQYANNNFFDPIRGEHRDVSFGFLSYSLPIDPQSSRAWNFIFDPQWFSFCELAQGSFSFDFATYRQLDCAGRRLFLLLHKMLYRLKKSPRFELRHLAVNVLGYADSIQTFQLKDKVARLIATFVDLGIVVLPDGCTKPSELIVREGKGRFTVEFTRGSYFDRKSGRSQLETLDSPLVEPLASIGFEQHDIIRIIDNYSGRLVQEWADITLSAIEHNRIEQSPQQFFRYYIKQANEKRATPPDWWRELRKLERQQHSSETPLPQDDEAFDSFLANQGRQVFDTVMQRICAELQRTGKSEREAKTHAERIARTNLQHQFKQTGGMVNIGDILERYR